MGLKSEAVLEVAKEMAGILESPDTFKYSDKLSFCRSVDKDAIMSTKTVWRVIHKYARNFSLNKPTWTAILKQVLQLNKDKEKWAKIRGNKAAIRDWLTTVAKRWKTAGMGLAMHEAKKAPWLKELYNKETAG